MLQETSLQGVWVTVDEDSSDCSLPVLIAMFSMTFFLLDVTQFSSKILVILIIR